MTTKCTALCDYDENFESFLYLDFADNKLFTRICTCVQGKIWTQKVNVFRSFGDNSLGDNNYHLAPLMRKDEKESVWQSSRGVRSLFWHAINI